MNLAALLLGVVVWLVAASLPAQNEAAAQSPAAPAKTLVVKNVTPDETEKLLKTDTNIVVVDIRTPREFAAGHIAGATNLNFYATDFAAQLAKLDKSKPYVVHCATGGRSTNAVEDFKKLEFQTLYHLNTGMAGWERAGKPVTK